MSETVRNNTVKLDLAPAPVVKNFSVKAYVQNKNPKSVIQNPFQSKNRENKANITPQRANIDIEELTKKYKNNPTAVIDVLGIEFTDEEKAILAESITDEKSLKSFLNILLNDELSTEDIVAGVEILDEIESSSFFSRVKNVFTTIFEDGFSEAYELAKSERVYKAQKLGENMNFIRKERNDFSSQGLAKTALAIANNKKLKNNVIHFVTKKNSQNLYLYDEASTLKATNYMVTNKKLANIYVANAVQLEAITGKNNNIKYQGSTIVDVATRMTNAPELKSTMLSIGRKNDMNDAYFNNITENLYKNPEMKKTMEFMCNTKDSNNNDKFSAYSMNNSSNHLVDKEKVYCEKYYINTKQLTTNTNLSGDNITKITEMITLHPDLKDKIISKINNSNLSETEILQACQNIIETESKMATNTGTSNYAADTVNNTQTVEKTEKEPYDGYTGYYEQKEKVKTQELTLNNVENEKTKTITIKGQEYPREVIIEQLAKKYGTDGEKVLQNLESNPEFVEYVTDYNNNKSIMKQLIDDPQSAIITIKKLKIASPTISNKEMDELISICTNSKITESLIAQVEKLGAAQAIKMFKKAKIENKMDEALYLFEKTNNVKAQKQQFENLMDNRQTRLTA